MVEEGAEQLSRFTVAELGYAEDLEAIRELTDRHRTRLAESTET